MGGWNSGQGHNKNHSVVEIDSMPAFEVSKELDRLAEKYGLDRSAVMNRVAFTVSGISLKVEVTREPRNLGGYQYFWLCPCCSRKCRVLRAYLTLIVCQKCLPREKFRYASQREGEIQQSHRRMRRVGKKLSENFELDLIHESTYRPPPKPHKVRWETYRKLAREYLKVSRPARAQFFAVIKCSGRDLS